MPQPTATSRWARVARFAALGLGGLVALVVVLVATALLVVDLPPVRRFAVAKLNAALASDFKGKITIGSVGGLHVTGVSDVDVVIQAPDGTPVIVATGVRARIAPVALLASFLRRHDDLRIDVFDVDAKALDVDVDSDEAGVLELQQAFAPAQPSSGPPGRPTRLQFPTITFAHAHIHGQMKGAPLVDADLDRFRGSVLVAPDATTIDVAKLDLTTRQMPQGANPRGSVQAHLSLPGAPEAKLGLDASFGGDVGGIPATAHAVMKGDDLDAVLDVPKVAADKVRALVADAPIYEPASAHAEAHGPLSALQATAHATVGGGELDVHGNAALTGKLAATAAIDVRGVDLRAFSPTAQSSDLGLHADVRVETKKDGTLAGQFDVAVHEGTIGDQPIPSATFNGGFDQEPGDGGFDVTARGVIAEPGAPVVVRVGVRTHPPAPVVTFDVRSTVERLADVKRFGGLGTGNADVHVSGSATLGTPVSVDVAVGAVIQGFQHGSMRLKQANVEATASGPVAAPSLKIALGATELAADRYKFSSAKVNTQGAFARQSVTADLRGDGTPSVSVRATVGLGAVTTIENGDVSLSRGKGTMQLHVDRVRVASAQLDVVGGVLTGLGEPAHVALRVRPEMVTLKGDSKGLDLKGLGYLLGIEDKLREGTLSFAADFSAHRAGATGTAVVDLDNGCFANIDGLTAHTDLRMEGRNVSGVVNAAAAGIGSFSVSDLHLTVGVAARSTELRFGGCRGPRISRGS